MKDLLLNDAGDLQITGAGLVIGISDQQHQEHLLIGQKGSVKQFPDTCVGIENYINTSDTTDMLREIRYQYEQDGMVVNTISYDEQQGKLTHDAEYKS